jgi:DNA primase
MGTSLTEQQAKVLKKLTRCLALALDADAAGIQATLRGIDVVDRALDKKVVPIPTWRGLVRYESTVDAELNIIVLPPGKDPDDVIREDRAAWQCLVDGAISVMDFILDTATSQTDLNDSQGRTQVVNQVLPAIAEIREPIRQSSYLQKLAQLVRLDERFLWDALREARVSKKRHTEHMASEELIPLAVFSNPTEEYCLALTLQNPDLKTQCEEISPDYFENSAAREVFRRWLESPDIEALQDSLDPSLKSLLDHLMAKSLPPSNTTQRPHQLSDCVLRLRERWLRNLEAQKEMLLLQEAESGGADAELARLLEQGTDIPQKLHELFQKPKGKRRLRNGLGQ